MGFVEAVAGEFFEQVEDLVGLGGGDVVGLRATLDEGLALLLHFLDLFLAHRAAQQVRAAERVAGQHLRGLHDLLLVNHDAVGLAADRLQQRMFVFNLHLAVAALDEFRDEFHRAGR